MLQLKVGPQGIRGRVDQGLDMGQIIDLTGAYATWLDGGPVLVARDTRPSSPMLYHAVLSALSAAGSEVLDAGICPTAMAQREGALQRVAGMISITASHNDAAWNGLKLFGDGGRVLASAEGREILDVWHQGEYAKAPYNKLGAVRKLDDVVDRYLDYLEQIIDVDLVSRARIRAVVDACNGSGAMVLPELCRRLGVELIPISCEPSGSFPHPPDPSARNMAQVAAIIQPVDAHVGFGLSSDCERISMVTDRGEALGTEATLPLMAQQILAEDGDPPIIVASAAVDSRVEQVARMHGARVHRCGVGVQAVMQGMALEGAAVGGEWSGGVAVSKFHLAFDGLAVLARLLQAVASQGSGHALADALPRVYTRTATVPCPVSRAYSVVSLIRSETQERNMVDLDGVRVELDSGWFYVRVSHTEPVIRIFCEAGSDDQADELMDRVHQRIQSAMQGV